MYPSIYILALPGGLGTGVTAPGDLFETTNVLIKNLAGEGAEQLRWKVISVDGKPVTTASGLRISVDGKLADIKEPGWLMLAGVVLDSEEQLDAYLQQQWSLIETIRQLHTRGIKLSATCTGTFLLAESGLLNGQTATTTWWLYEFFQRRYPDIELQPDKLITNNDDIVCAGTATAVFDLALHLIRKIVGRKYAHLCAKYLLLENRPRSQAAYQRLTPDTKNDPFIESAMQWIKPRIKQDIRVDELAAALATSQRTLVRRFKKSTGESPVQFIQKVRIEKSKNLLETSRLSSDEIMQRVGYQDDSTFRRLFKRHTGLTPNQYRQRFAMKR